MLNKNNKLGILQKELAQIPQKQLITKPPSRKKTFKYTSYDIKIKTGQTKLNPMRNKSAQNIYNADEDLKKMTNLHFYKDTLPTLSPPPRSKTKSTLEKILDDRQRYAQSYFTDIKKQQSQKDKDKKKEENYFDYEFPEIKVQKWKIKGYLKGDYIFLNGKKGKDSLIKKYNYSVVYDKVKKDYFDWAQSKFYFES